METPYKPEWFNEELKKIGGTFQGKDVLRVVWSPSERKPNGLPKYPKPDNVREPMECWILETFIPAEVVGSLENWNEEVFGAYPSEGVYGIKSPLMYGDGKTLPLDRSTLNAIKDKQFFDVQWLEMNEEQRLELLGFKQSAKERQALEEARKECDDIYDHYYTHAEELNNADNRVFTFPNGMLDDVKNNKLPVR